MGLLGLTRVLIRLSLPSVSQQNISCYFENTHSGGSRLGPPLNSGGPNPASSPNPLFYDWIGERKGESEKDRARGSMGHGREREKDKDTDRDRETSEARRREEK